MVDPKATSTTITFMGLPAQPQHLHVMNVFKNGDPRNAIPIQGAEGDYKVTFVLWRPGFNLQPENNCSFATGLRGDSHLAITKPAFVPPGNPDADQIRIYGRTEDGAFQFAGFPNERGFLGKIESASFKARDRADAEKKAYRALASSLSNWSIHLDVPLEVYQIDTVEMITGNTQMSLTTPYWEAPFAVTPTAEMKPEFRGYASLYREALGSNSTVYRFLCFYKITEGILSRRTRLAEEARSTGQPVTRHHEYLPQKPEEIAVWLNAIFPIRRTWDAMALESVVPPEVRGRRFGYVISNILQPLRVDIAHALSSKSRELTMSVDELLHIEKISKWLLPAKCIVRRMLKNEFPAEFLSYLRDDGTFVK
ncbi:MAG TPA: methylamine utilization protein MauJ [Terriglobales bacterium]|nr:methylamine utilization protein MauJ [Terriglobales bacterium]